MKTDKIQNTAITSFRGKYAFLSNFYEALIEYNGLRFRNNEAAFQAMKNPREAYRFTELSAKEALRVRKNFVTRSSPSSAAGKGKSSRNASGNGKKLRMN